jgi:hypothetical protein
VKKASVTATANVTVTAVATNSNLLGQYAFKISGFDASGDYYAAAGSVTLDGNGNVTTGEEDFNDTTFTAPSIADGLSGTYTVGNDGQGTMTLNAVLNGTVTPDPNVGVSGVQTLAFTVVNNNHLIVSEFDSAYTSGGSMDLQSGSAITAGLAGNYAFSGFGALAGEQYSVGGVLSISGAVSTGQGDQDLGGAVGLALGANGAVVTPDSNGRGTLAIGGLNVAYYMVGTEVAYTTEIDTGGVFRGVLIGQGSAPNFSAASFTGNYVISQPWGFDVGGELGLAGQFTPDGTSSISGVVDYNDTGLVPAGPGPDTLTATYAVATTGYGSITSGVVSGDPDITTFGLYATDPAINLVDPNSTTGGGGALVVELDANTLGAGFFVPQSSTSPVAGNLASSGDAGAFGATISGPLDFVGHVVSDGSANVNGSGSLNEFNFDATDTESVVTLVGTFAADSSNAGRYTEQLTINGSSTANSIVYYQASSGLAFSVDVDGSSATNPTVATGVTEAQQ